MRELIDIYGPTVTRGAGLPGEAFTSEELFRLEAVRVFHRSWCCIGLVQDVAEPNQVCPLEFLGQPLLMTHNRNGIEVFHNVCSHRGAVLATEPKSLGRNQTLICPYHSWTYSLEGELVRTPHAGGARIHEDEAIDRKACGLKRVRSATWNSLVFVNLSGDAVSFEEFIAPLARRTDFLDKCPLRHDAALSRSAVANSNWKILIENFAESYHLPAVHRDLQRVNPMERHYQILGGASYIGAGGDGRDWQKAGGENDLPPRPPGRFQTVAQYEVFWLFPNLFFQPVGNFCFAIIHFPRSAHLTHQRLEFFFYGEKAMQEAYAAERRRQAEFILQVNSEDIGICERVQAGRASRGFTGGVFCLGQEKTSLRAQQIISLNMLSGMDESAGEAGEFSFEDIRFSDPAGSQP